MDELTQLLIDGGRRALEQNDRLMEERDETRKWVMLLAEMVRVDVNTAPVVDDKDIIGSWREVRRRVIEQISTYLKVPIPGEENDGQD